MNLNQENIFKIADSKSRQEAIDIVRKNIAHNYFTVSDIMRNEILFEGVLDLIEFCLKKGFTIPECHICCDIFYTIIQKLKCTDESSSNLNTILDVFYIKLNECSVGINDHKLKELIDYMNTTVFSHVNLYKFVLKNERENDMIYEERPLIAPEPNLVESNKLNQAKPFHVWEYEEKLHELDRKEKKLTETYMIERENSLKEEAVTRNLMKYIHSDSHENNKPLDEESIKRLVDEISIPILRAATRTIKCDFDEFREKSRIHKTRKTLLKSEENENGAHTNATKGKAATRNSSGAKPKKK